MYALFTEFPAPNGGSFIPGQIHTLRAAIKRTVKGIVDYYEGTTMAVPSTHFLNQILGFYGSQYQSSAFEAFRYVRGSYLNLCQTLKITSPASIGRAFDGVFYGPGIKEVIIARSHMLDYDKVSADWRSIKPIKVLLHPFTNMRFNLPDGVNNTNEGGLAVFELDIPALILKYRAFRIYERSLIDGDYPDYVHKTPFQFIHMHVLPSMLESHVDQVMVNRFKALLLNESLESAASRHSFRVIDHSRGVDEILKPIVRDLNKKSLTFPQMLKYIPTIYAADGFELAALHDVFRTRQTNWAWSVARNQFIEILLNLDRRLPGTNNDVYIQYWKRTYVKYVNGGDVRSVIPKPVLPYWEEVIGQIPDYDKSALL